MGGRSSVGSRKHHYLKDGFEFDNKGSVGKTLKLMTEEEFKEFSKKRRNKN